MADKGLKVILFMGSTRVGRNGLRVAKFMERHLVNKGYQVDIWDPIELNLPLLQQPLHFYPDPKQAPAQLVELNEKIKAADAFTVVSAEYNGMIPPALTNMLDQFPPSSYAYKPSMIVTYSLSRAGGVVCQSAVRTFLSYLSCHTIADTVVISEVTKSLDEQGKPLTEYPDKIAGRAIAQFDWVINAYHDKKMKDGLPSK